MRILSSRAHSSSLSSLSCPIFCRYSRMSPSFPTLRSSDLSETSRRPLRGDTHGLVEISRFDQEDAADLLFSFGERAVCDRKPPVADAQCRSRACALERPRVDQVTTLPQVLDILERLTAQRLPVRLRHVVEQLLFLVGKAQVFHRKRSA